MKFRPKTMSTHSKWANEQTLKQSKMTNPLFFQYAFVTSSKESKNPLHAFKNDTQVYYKYHERINLTMLNDSV